MNSGTSGAKPPHCFTRRPRASGGKPVMQALAGLLIAAVAVFSQATPWNLPYARPAAYDYSALYAANLKLYLSLKPDYFKQELQSAWGYWKQNFLMSNGLVNHRRLKDGNLIGANEAVSEGQGYGLLLAVLLNDQATFNRIFQAANANMWDGGKKSYKWTWPSGSSGAATDADLDIGLALVFADELVKAKLWPSYNQGGVTYNSRAMDVIKSIRNNMTAQNYLLPGDNWGGDAVNNLNPSYFATAWLKVFNEYQKEVDFTPVINNCYAVLAKVPRYGFGQAPDWCNPGGGQASQGGGKPEGGMGMLSDGIRTPWRIGMDALWFKDPRAIAYCKNTQKTLTEYNNANPKILAAQMAHYGRNGQSITETRGSFDNVTMWITAVLGSGIQDFCQKATDSQVMALISGSSAPHLGTQELQDDKFYYKQSIGMLGFASIGGHFPNMLADEKAPVGILRPLREDGKPGAMAGRLFRDGSLVLISPEGKAVPSVHNALGRAFPLRP